MHKVCSDPRSYGGDGTVMKPKKLYFALASAGLLAAFALNPGHTGSRASAPAATAQAPAAKPASPPTKLFDPTPVERADARKAYSGMPLTFEPNQGQTNHAVKFQAKGEGYNFFLTPRGAHFAIFSKTGKPNSGQKVDKALITMALAGANLKAEMRGEEGLVSRSNYIFGKDLNVSNVPNFRKVRCEQVYPGVDVVYYGNQKQLEYDFVVAPNTDPSVIQLAFAGHENISLDDVGNLVLKTGNGEIVQHRPFMFQRLPGGDSVQVKGEYTLGAQENGVAHVSFKVGDYDHTLPLVIDPVLVYSTFFGDKPNQLTDPSDHSGDEVGNGIAIDSQGNAYIVGFTNSYEFPEQNPIEVIEDPVPHGLSVLDVHFNPEKYYSFVCKFDPTGSSLIFSTKFGAAIFESQADALPPHFDAASAIAVDTLGNIYICGNTNSSSFPIKNALHGYSSGIDTFLMKMSSNGANLLFSTYLGGRGDDIAFDIAWEASGYIYVVGMTNSIDMPVSHAFQNTLGGGNDAFVAKFRDDGSEQTYCTYLGGTLDDGAVGVATDSSGNVYLTGFTDSTNFPFAAPLQVSNGGGRDAFVTKINANGNLLVYSTYLGGTGGDIGNGIAVDAQGNAYVTGTTTSPNFPTVSQTVLPVQTTLNGASDAFVTKIDKFGASLVYSTYFGGELAETGVKIRVDNRNAVYVIGTTSSLSFPVSPGFNTFQNAALHNDPLVGPPSGPINTGQNMFARPISNPPTVVPLIVTVPPRPVATEGYLAKFNPTGTPLVYSTYLGAGAHTLTFDAFDPIYHNAALSDGSIAFNSPAHIRDVRNTVVALTGLAVDNAGNAYITGSTEGEFFYTFGAFSRIGPKFPAAGEDFPAPIVSKVQLGAGIRAGADEYFAGEASPTIFIDNRDVILCKVGDSAPLITSSLAKLGTKGISLAYTIVATNNPTSYNAAGLPPGLTVNTADGTIAGTPSQTGNFQVVLTATNPSGTGAAILFLTVSVLPPTITSALSVTANVDSIFRYQITADNDAGIFTATNLPLGLTLDANTGLISGTPLVPGASNVTITAGNASGNDQKTLVINVLPPLPVITSATITQGVFNLAYTAVSPLYTITATNNPTQFNAVGLPPGLTLDKTTGKITGTPGSLGFFNVTLTATNGGGSATALWKLSIIPPIVPQISSAGVATGIVNEPFSYKIEAINNPLSFAIDPTTPLPPGLTLNDVTGVISGTPTTAAGTTVNIQAINTAGTGSKPLTITIVNPATPVITSPLSATAIANTPFEYDIQAANHPVTFSAAGLPPGFSVNTATGQITGQTGAVTPPGAPFSITINATNAGGTGSATLTLTVIAQQIPVILSAGAVQGYVNIPLTYQTVANGLPTTYSAVGLPTGTTINAGSGLVSGTPTTAGSFPATISATNAVGTGSKTVTFTISNPVAPVFTSPNTAFGNDGATFSYTISATGSSPITFTAAPLPLGLSQINNNTIFGKPSGGVTAVVLTAFNPATNPSTPNGAPNPGGIAPVTFTLTLNIASAPATVSNTILTATATVNTPFNFPIVVSGTAPIQATATTAPPPNTIQNPLPAAQLPPGLMLTGNSTVGFAITGTPTESAVTLNGPIPINLIAANAVGGNSKVLMLTVVPEAPVITSTNYVTGVDGQPFRYSITATGTPLITFTAKDLPPGLTLTDNVISGRPTSAAIGLTNVTLTASNKGTVGDTMTLIIQIDPAAPKITSPASVNASSGVPFTFNVTADGSPTIDFVMANLPPGLLQNNDKISGTPTTPGVYNTVVNASNSAGTDTQTLVITVLPAPPVIAGAVINADDGVPFTFTPTVTGAQPITFSATGLPSGVALNPLTGVISGTATNIGTFTINLKAVNPGGSGSQTITLIVGPSAPTITSSLLAQGSPNIPFLYTITATGTGPITFQVGNLTSVPGLTFASPDIKGTPLGPIAKTPVTLIATNAFGQDTKILVVDIAQTPPTLTNVLQVSGQEGQPFTFKLTATGSPTIVFGATPLPAGLSLNTATGVISGTPTAVGLTNVNISATNTFGADTGKVLAISIAASPARVTSADTASGGVGEAFSYTITATGSKPITFGADALPPGLTVDKTTGVISGAPTAPGVYVSNITATNAAGSDAKQLTITIVERPPVITSPQAASASTTAPFNYTITATGKPPITFTVSGLPSGLTFSNNTISGTAKETGTFQVTITATNSAGTSTLTLVLTVTEDLDGDGFPDDFEVFLGTNPSDPTSNGFTGGKGTFAVLNVTAMSVKLNFAKPGSDVITAKGSIPLANGFNPSGQTATVYVSGLAFKIPLSAKASGKSGGNSFAIKAGKNSGAIFSFTLKGSFAAKLAALGMTNETIILPRSIQTTVLVLLNNTLFRSDKLLTYRAKQGKTGSAK